MKETAQMKKPQCSLKVTQIRGGINYHKHTRPHTKRHLMHSTVCLTSFSEWSKTLLDIFDLWKPRVEPPEITDVVCRLCVQIMCLQISGRKSIKCGSQVFFSVLHRLQTGTAAAESPRRNEAIMETIQKHSVTQGDECDWSTSIWNVWLIYARTFVQQQIRIWLRLKWSDWMVWRAITLSKGSKISTHVSMSFGFSDRQRTTNPWL